ncbi:hypothetical protein MPTK1_8g12640 [Marchantia polymorpha subsp. ruderalis]|uniref:EF-hand domain-containing protein n=2 Tax=Marchantia polymorpha TaxID=3197 RepID=A0A176WMY0_MARPO|nr:hypothetical protein AXG93_2953s1030 [Marchantia polymorpha subsp. ruderalis]PTQ34094.1 hypothetical protein MARPO_0083s0056 [Marchantia polymorpha]BBN19673.1 hypothetical protein Mp_8g12640 [Marchantia polymorpha subsp. ruderalis]|eukprot:PTQ34094.1 hypothetical protein MARPO_0083s0056 [Marchantia polymorpha]
MEEEGSVRVLDGSQITAALPTMAEKAQKKFKEIDTANKGYVTPADVKSAAVSEAAALLLGTQVSAQVFDSAIKGVPLPEATTLNQEAFATSLIDCLRAIANALHDEPIVVSVLDGSTIRALLDDEDEFAMVAENLFTDLDVDESGKLNRSELRPAVLQLGLEQGVPPPSAKPEADELITKLLQKYSADGSEELGQAQFAELLQTVLQDLADSLTNQPIIIVRDVRVLNGSKIRKMLENEKALAEVADNIFADLDANKDGKLTKNEIRPLFENQGSQWGLPSPEESEAVNELYNELFKEIDSDKSGQVDKSEFKVLTKVLFEGFAEQLRLEPILVNVDAAYR